MADTGLVTPTFAEIVDRVSDDLNARLPGEDSRIRRSFLYVLARVVAGSSFTIYGFARFIARQVIWDRASGAELQRWARLFGIDPKPATKASGPVRFTGVNGSTVGLGVEVRRDDGELYKTIETGDIAGGVLDLDVQAVKRGAAGNADASTIVALTTPIAGVDSAATVQAAGLTGGADAEADDPLRERFVERVRNTPQGGADADYVGWAKAAPGVTGTVDRVFVDSPQEGEVRVMFTLEGTGAAVIPAAGDVTAVQDYIDEEDADGHSIRRPTTAVVNVVAPTADSIPFTITVFPNTAAVQQAVKDELEALFRAAARPGGTIKNSRVREAIARAGGEEWHTLDAVDGGAGTADIVAASATHLPILGTVTWGNPP